MHFWLLPFVKPIHVRRAFPEETVESYTDACRVAVENMGVDPEHRKQPARIMPANIQHLIDAGFGIKAIRFAFLGILRQQYTTVNTAGIHLLQ